LMEVSPEGNELIHPIMRQCCILFVGRQKRLISLHPISFNNWSPLLVGFVQL
jgi:hypothetical protein